MRCSLELLVPFPLSAFPFPFSTVLPGTPKKMSIFNINTLTNQNQPWHRRLNHPALPVTHILLSLVLGCWGMLAEAHVKWFVPLDEPTPDDFSWFAFSDTAVQVWIGVAVLLIATSLYLDRRLPTPQVSEAKALPPLLWILRICLGLSLLLSANNGALIAPHYAWPGYYFESLRLLEVVTALLLFTPWVVFAGIGVLLLYVGVAAHYQLEVIEYLNIAGAGLFLAIHHHPNEFLRARWLPYALPVLRVTTGIALVNLAFAEKLARPDYAQNFVQTYMWNFMHNLGISDFTDRLFVLSAGTMEVVFGTILILGSTTRLNILVVSGFMLASNLTFFLEGHMLEAFIEIIGHMPIIATALFFLVLGSGHKWKLSSWLHAKLS
jgi:uncharacterized membrane protein YphA (DoxX/SURF4 family)